MGSQEDAATWYQVLESRDGGGGLVMKQNQAWWLRSAFDENPIWCTTGRLGVGTVAWVVTDFL